MEDQGNQVDARIIVPVAAAVVAGLAVWSLLEGFIRYIFCPIIAAFIGSSRFELNSFTINASEVPYGAFLETVFAVVAVWLALSFVVPEFKRSLKSRFPRQGGRES